MESYTLADPAPTPPAPQAENGGTPPPKKSFPKPLLIGGIIGGFVLFFLLGLLVSSAGRKNAPQAQTIAPTEVPTVTPRSRVSTTPPPDAGIQYQIGKPYYDDSLMIITKSDPHQVLQVSISRFGQAQGFTQYSKVNYYTGSAWLRENITTSIQRADIVTTPLIKRWGIKPVATVNIRDGNGIDVTIENKTLTFSLKKLSNDISTHALEGYTRFNYFGEGTLKTSDEQLDAYVVYTQSFALNSSDVSFLSTPQKLKSDWLVFWDEQGTAYYLDGLSSGDTNNPRQNYKVGAVIFPNGTTQKVSGFNLSASSQNNQYNATLPSAVQVQLNFILGNALNKATSKAYTWQSGTISGTAQSDGAKVNGFGIMESIH